MQNNKKGKIMPIYSYKHDGKQHRVWDHLRVLYEDDKVIIGYNEKANVYDSDGKCWTTREPAITFFYKHQWFNVIAMLRDKGIFYYCNMASPVVWDKEGLKYIDYDLDLKVYPTFKYKILDKWEYNLHKKKFNYSEELDTIIKHELESLKEKVRLREEPFNHKLVMSYYEKATQIKN